MMDRRSKICLWIIWIGLANFLLYAVLYSVFYGEAVNGQVRIIGGKWHFFLQSGKEVPRWVFYYSGIHSITIWPTVAAIMLAMLTLAKDRIISAVHKTIVRGRAVITVLAIVIALITSILTYVFIREFVHRFESPVVVRKEAAPASLGGKPARGVVIPAGLAAKRAASAPSARATPRP